MQKDVKDSISSCESLSLEINLQYSITVAQIKNHIFNAKAKHTILYRHGACYALSGRLIFMFWLN